MDSKYYSIILVLFCLFLECTSTKCTFPSGFKFGTATSAYQIEGGWNVSGKSPSIWDVGVHNYPEKIIDHSTGDVACDSYNQIDTDIENLKFLNASFYRFSISWPRLLPNGDNSRINPDGKRYYNKLINKLLANNIEPIITIFHWDLPQVLQEIGGWTNPDMIEYFQQFARTCYTLYGDRVKTWLTFNEISTYCINAYDNLFPPFANSPGIGTYLCAHNMLLAHGHAYRMYKKEFYKQNGKIGLAIESLWYYPASNSTADKNAVQRALATSLNWLAHPIFSKTGDYPLLLKRLIRKASSAEGRSISRLPRFTADEILMLRGSADFFGLNHYTSAIVVAPLTPIPEPTPSMSADKQILYSYDSKWRVSARSFFRVVPDGIRKILNYIKDQYNNPKVFITENGYAGFPNETTNDDDRVDYIHGYLTAVSKAINEDGCNVKAYTAWSFMDNMEWTDGYTMRFGLIHVDFNNPKRTRTPKKSFSVYKKILASGMLDQCYNYQEEGSEDETSERMLAVLWLKERVGPTVENVYHN